MRNTSFRWFLKKRLTEATDTGTLNLKTLEKMSAQDAKLNALLSLYISAYLSYEDVKHRFKLSPLLDNYGRYYCESGFPDRDMLREMPDVYHEIYNDYIRYISEKRTSIRIKTRCRQELIETMKQQNLSQRKVGKLCDVDFACVSRFMHGSNYALGMERLKDILNTLKDNTNLRYSQLYINNYSETEIAKGMIEISFTLNISSELEYLLKQFCQENNITVPQLIASVIYAITEKQKKEGQHGF